MSALSRPWRTSRRVSFAVPSCSLSVPLRVTRSRVARGRTVEFGWSVLVCHCDRRHGHMLRSLHRFTVARETRTNTLCVSTHPAHAPHAGEPFFSTQMRNSWAQSSVGMCEMRSCAGSWTDSCEEAEKKPVEPTARSFRQLRDRTCASGMSCAMVKADPVVPLCTGRPLHVGKTEQWSDC